MDWEWMKKLQDQMEEELEGAEKYIKCAIEMKDQDRPTADSYYSMAQQEATHFSTLESMARTKVKELEMEDDPNYTSMKILYDYLHEKMMDKMAKISSWMNMYKG